MSKVLHVKELLQLLSSFNLIKEYSAGCESIAPAHITMCSKDVTAGSLFICKGAAFKKEYLLSAVNEGGAVIYMSEQQYPEAEIPFIIVNDIRKAMALSARWFFGCPGDKMAKVGVTGTKGKTTVTFVINDILEQFTDNHCAAFSTHEIHIGKNVFETTLTTPEPVELQGYFDMAVQDKCTHTVMEVSSQAMKMNRVYGETYKVGIFTNIDCDHISPTEHASMEDYLQCKISFLRQCENVVLYYGTRFFDDVYNAVRDKHVIVYGSQVTITEMISSREGFWEPDTEFAMLHNEELTDKSSSFELIYGGQNRAYSSNLIGDYNVENLAAAIVAAHLLGVPYELIRSSIKDVYVPGRMQLYYHNDSTFMVDYAHNYISMYRLYNMVRSTLKPKTVTAVFGCGGERYKKRREDMGRLADEYADKIILTMEDPGYESCEDICNEIKQYITKPCRIIVDREEALTRALDEAQPGELVITTGKGIENTQRINGTFVQCHSDAQVIEHWLTEHAGD